MEWWAGLLVLGWRLVQVLHLEIGTFPWLLTSCPIGVLPCPPICAVSGTPPPLEISKMRVRDVHTGDFADSFDVVCGLSEARKGGETINLITPDHRKTFSCELRGSIAGSQPVEAWIRCRSPAASAAAESWRRSVRGSRPGRPRPPERRCR